MSTCACAQVNINKPEVGSICYYGKDVIPEVTWPTTPPPFPKQRGGGDGQSSPPLAPTVLTTK